MGSSGTLWPTLKYPVAAYGREGNKRDCAVPNGADRKGSGCYSGAAYKRKVPVQPYISRV